jgi:hypothetical protein
VCRSVAEWRRLFAWCEFLGCRDGVFPLYGPLLEVLRSYFGGLEEWA